MMFYSLDLIIKAFSNVTPYFCTSIEVFQRGECPLFHLPAPPNPLECVHTSCGVEVDPGVLGLDGDLHADVPDPDGGRAGVEQGEQLHCVIGIHNPGKNCVGNEKPKGQSEPWCVGSLDSFEGIEGEPVV